MTLTQKGYVVLASLTLVACSGPSIIAPKESGWTAATDSPPSRSIATVETTSLYWRCGKSGQQWLCHEPVSALRNQSQPTPNAGTLTAATDQATAETAIETTVETTIAAAPKTVRKSRGDNTVEEPNTLPEANARPEADQQAKKTLLSSYPDHFFAIQLTAAKYRETIAHYRHQNPQLTATVYRARLQNEPIQLLIMGVFSSYQEAQQRLSTLSQAPSEIPWIRPLGPLKALLAEPSPE